MTTHDLNKIFDELEQCAVNLSHRLDIKVQISNNTLTLENKLHLLENENSILKAKNEQLQDNQKTWQNRLRSVLEKINTN